MPTILVVDDHPENQYLLHALLSGYGYDVLLANHGEMALELALQQPPNLIVSDLLMPVMDGFRLCRIWKAHPKLQTIPFVIYTATYTDPHDELLARSLGADAFIIKPAEPTVFIAEIQAVLARHQSGQITANSPQSSDDDYICAYNATLLHKLEQKMAELEQTNQRLQASESRLRAIASASPDLICVLDSSGSILELLTPTTTLLPPGAPAAHQIALTDLLAPPEAERLRAVVQQTLATGVAQELAQALQLPSGERWFEGRTSPLNTAVMGAPAVVLAARDITDRKQAEWQLQHAQKIELIGQLTAGIAHDFNNLLTVINGYTGMLLDDAPPDLLPTLELVAQAGERAATLTRQLLAFSRKQLLHPEPTNLNQVICGVENLLRRVIGSEVELSIDLAPDLGLVVVDPGQIEQVILNLAINARDAMPAGGRLGISTAPCIVPTDTGMAGVTLPAGQYLLLTVSDSGHGMSSEVQARIFEPFFTTKAPGTGTGLGLAVVYGIITQSGGHVAVSSALGTGTRMQVYLPLTSPPQQGTEPGPPVARQPAQASVLLVGPDTAVRGFIRQVLEQAGYRVLEAADGAGALKQASTYDAPIQLLLSDLTLPDLPVGSLARQLRQQQPDIHVLLLSSYTDETIAKLQPSHEQATFLAKPLSAHTLVRKVRSILAN